MLSETDSRFQAGSASYMKLGQESSRRALASGPLCGAKGKEKIGGARLCIREEVGVYGP